MLTDLTSAALKLRTDITLNASRFKNKLLYAYAGAAVASNRKITDIIYIDFFQKYLVFYIKITIFYPLLLVLLTSSNTLIN